MLEKLAFKDESTPKEFGKLADAPKSQAVPSGD